MKKFIKVILAIFEFIFYTYFMVLVGELETNNQLLILVVHFLSLLIISIILYYIIRFILKKLDLKSKRDIYEVCLLNIGIGLIFPIILIILIPNVNFTTFALVMLISTGYYGILINIIIALLNHFLTNRQKK